MSVKLLSDLIIIKMLSKTELGNLIENVLDPNLLDELTFDQCMQKFHQQFKKSDTFRVCSAICYLIETQVSPKP